jgi:hypothetical protein
MRVETDAMMLVRADLCERLETLRHLSRRGRGHDFDGAVVGVRQLAAAYGLVPVVQLAEALERAGRRDGSGGCQRALYLDRLQDAIGCTRLDEAAGQAMIASISVRFGT